MFRMPRGVRRELEEVADRIENCGCDLCGVVLGGPVPHHFGWHDGALVGVCCNCVGKLDKRSPWSGVFSMPAPWQENDREWFEAHPWRSFRLRRPIGQEVVAMQMETRHECPVPGVGCTLAVAVWQREPGLRARQIVLLTGPPHSYSEAEIKLLVPWQSPGLRQAVESVKYEAALSDLQGPADTPSEEG